ncbi:unnamed protein product [Mytilus coruscus]|uniref:Uncharacterized protein n=1 Tax=Mytilus coruscus TaxID=42192 RepID=A0A6J8EGB7_MYTCO|nr:unnamed protein product [Mytilus coruscus]
MQPVHHHPACCQQLPGQPSPQNTVQLLEMNSFKDIIKHIEETRQLYKRIQELEINNINHRITALESSQQNMGYTQQQYRFPQYIHPPPNTKEVHRTIYENVTRDQVTVTRNPQQDKRLSSPQQREKQLVNNEKLELQRQEIAFNNTQEITHDSDIELQTLYSKKKDSDEINSKSHRASPVNSLLDFRFSNLNTPQLSPQSHNFTPDSTEDQAENLVNSILDFNQCKNDTMSPSPQKHENGEWEERQLEEKNHFLEYNQILKERG